MQSIVVEDDEAFALAHAEPCKVEGIGADELADDELDDDADGSRPDICCLLTMKPKLCCLFFLPYMGALAGFIYGPKVLQES
jgi:hypothetical protein